MIPKPSVDDIRAADLAALVGQAIPEGRTLEYKRDLPGRTDQDKKEFCADVSAFANAGGGDIIFGISEAGGVPSDASGLGTVDIDKEILRLSTGGA